MEKLSPYFNKADKRGEFVGITQDSWAEVNFIETRGEQVRGNHYHKETRELFFIIAGEIDITIEDLNSGKRVELSVSKGDMFVVEPYELHTFRTKTDAQWINLLSKAVDQQNPDFHKVVDKS